MLRVCDILMVKPPSSETLLGASVRRGLRLAYRNPHPLERIAAEQLEKLAAVREPLTHNLARDQLLIANSLW